LDNPDLQNLPRRLRKSRQLDRRPPGKRAVPRRARHGHPLRPAPVQVRPNNGKPRIQSHPRPTAPVQPVQAQPSNSSGPASHPRPTAPAQSSNGKHEPVQGETARYNSRQRGTCAHPRRPAPGRPSNQKTGIQGQLLAHVAVQHKPVPCATVLLSAVSVRQPMQNQPAAPVATCAMCEIDPIKTTGPVKRVPLRHNPVRRTALAALPKT